MSPPRAKPPAIPYLMPRTESDLDKLMSAIEKHKSVGHQLGTLLNENKLTPDQVLDQAAGADSELYDVLDDIQSQREQDQATP